MWEYKKEFVNHISVDYLNEFGTEGWELVTCYPVPSTINNHVVLFKRKILPNISGKK